MRSPQKTMALWAMLIVVAILLFQMYEAQRHTLIRDFDYPKFLKALEAGEIESVTFNKDTGEIEGDVRTEYKDKYSGRHFQILGNTDSEGFKIVRENGITPKYIGSDNSLMTSVFLNWLPLIIIIGMFMFFMRQIQVGGGKAMSFGKSRARLLTENKNKVTFKDVAGVEEAKEDLQEIVAFLKEPKKFTRLGGRIPKGVLLVGPPGTGKTLLGRAVAGEANVPFFTISGSDFVEMFVGVGASRVRDLFEQGKKNAPCLIFIDEIDAVGRHRGAGMGGGHDEREQTLNQLLVEMDGFESNEGVILIAATNRPDVLDPALLRPGRFDRRVVVNKPDLKGRRKILEVHTRKTPLSAEVNLDRIARGTPGFSGADLENLVNEAALQAARENKPKIEQEDFEKAKDKVMMGSERKSMVISEKDRKITAYHEAGHTLVGKKVPDLDPIHKVTIIPRGMALGLTQTLPEEDQLNLSKKKAESMIAFLFGGRAAEELVFQDYTTGAGNDIERATELARRMVCEWGMSSKLGPLALERREGPVFLGMQSSQQRDYSDAKAEEIDKEVYRLVMEGYELAKKVLNDNIDVLHRMAEALLEHETIDGEEVEIIVKGGGLQEINERRGMKQEKLVQERKAAEEEEAKKKLVEEEKAKEEDDDRDPVGNPGPVTA
ncbi:MAG: ATP-dependent metallopeptidase FtsH/Yme1/Tma family protein [Bdellovibrionaceae bacterium]|nr:ATP-dependent zinc metalloprotease FtsH [Bdellovibrionales bacterium]MCB9083922.1 ATP-dependent metallopeptidase FtsH/Yme1/Tma family protein [Pseudobdellovibrionaceae bacterium]